MVIVKLKKVLKNLHGKIKKKILVNLCVKNYKENKQIYLDSKLRKQNRNIEFVKEYKQNNCCSICGEKDIRCLEFHHTDNNKEADISYLVYNGYSLKRIKKEIEKCIILCANCHRKIHN